MTDNAACEQTILQTGRDNTFNSFSLAWGSYKENFMPLFNYLKTFFIDTNTIALDIF